MCDILKTMRQATCHPSRKYFCKGLCNPCYQRIYPGPQRRERTRQRLLQREAERRYKVAHLGEIRERSRLAAKERRQKNPEYDITYRAANIDKLRAQGRARYAANPEHQRALALKQLYGMTVEQYDILLVAQDGVCALCGNPPGKRRLAVDHSHRTGSVRGLLCGRCNWVIACLGDEIEAVERAITYLRRVV